MLATVIAVSILLVASDPARPSPDDLAAYQEARAKVGRDSGAQVKLALWCEARGLTAERLEHLAIAVMADPSNAAARGLLGLVADGGRWRKPEDVAEKIQADAKLSADLAEYAERRARSPKTAEGHWKLALWCEEKGLKAESQAHLTACVRLDPGRTAAWKRMGCKKVGGRWMTEQEIADRKANATAQADADKRYRPLLAAWRNALRDKDEARRFEARTKLNSLKDPRATASVWLVFVLNAQTPADLNLAVQLLGQLDAPLASRGLAMIALDAIDPEVRRAATETLSRRDPRDYMGDLISLLRDELRWEVRPVGGPGLPGLLFVEGEQFRSSRYYAPPAPNFTWVDTGYSSMTDSAGFEVLRLPGTITEGPRDTGKVASVTGAEVRHGLKPNDTRGSALGAALGPNPDATRLQLPQSLFKTGWGSGGWLRDQDFAVDVHKYQTDTRATETEIPIGRIVNEYRKSAIVAEAQLEQDVARVKNQNDGIRARNARVTEVLNNLSNQAMPSLGKVWKSWWADQRGYAYVEPPAPPKLEVVENVPLAYTPQPIGSTFRVGQVVGSETSFQASAHLTSDGITRAQHAGLYADCFAAGTPVRTRLGMQPIEALEVGDHVLAQDMKTGTLGFKPILAVYKFRPAETIKVTFSGETLLTTAVHRFWRVGEGWVMARDLKPGDTVRTLGGSERVGSIEKDIVRPVFNLEVAHSSDYFVGKDGILAGDNTLQNDRPTPFDAPVRHDSSPSRR